MAAFIIVGFTIKNAEKLKLYGASTPATLAKYSGEIVTKGPAEILHGNFNYDSQVIISFPSKEDALSWYQSDDYQALAPVRDEGMDSQFQLIG
jgi:uncharacterized protein (DUF1330 family)